MTNAAQTVKAAGGIIAKMAAGFLDDHIQFVKAIDKADASDFDGKNGYQAGDTVQINLPAQFTLGTGADVTSTIQDVVEKKVALTVNNQYNVPIAFTSAEIATDMALKSWAKRTLEPAMITLANNIEKACLSQAVLATANNTGLVTSFDTDTSLYAGQRLDESGLADYDNRFMLLSPYATRSAVNARKGLFQSSAAIAEQYKSGAIGMADGFTYLRNNLLPSVTLGNDVTGVAVEADVVTPATGATTLGVDGLTNTTGTVKAGQMFTIAGVYDVHPVTKATLPSLKQFVVTADATANGSGQATLSISPTIYSSSSGGLQNVSALPSDESALTFIGSASTSYVNNLAFHKSAFRFVSLPLVKPDGVDMVGQETKNGISVRIVRAYDIKTDKMIMRADVLWGMANVRPEWACRLPSAS